MFICDSICENYEKKEALNLVPPELVYDDIVVHWAQHAVQFSMNCVLIVKNWLGI